MRILYFHQYFSTPRGAAGTRSYEMARRLVARGHRVLMVCGSAARGQTGLDGPFTRGQRRGDVDGIEVLEFELGYSNAHGFVRRAIAFLRFASRSVGVALREPASLVIATSTPLTAGIPGIIARWVRGTPFVFEVRDLWPELPKAMGVIRNPLVLGAMSMLEWVSYRTADRLIGLSPGIVEGIARRGIPRSRIAEIPNGCDVDLFKASDSGWRPPGVAPTDLVALFAGAHGIANGLDAVIAAAEELSRRGRTDIKFVLVGDGMLKPGLVARAARGSLGNVVFLDPMSKDRLAGLLAGADIGLQILANVPAFYDGTSPNKFFDYLAAGRAVLINYPGWLANVVRAERCGLTVPPEDPEAFATALEEVASARESLREMGRRGNALAHGRFDRSRLADQWMAWIEGTSGSAA